MPRVQGTTNAQTSFLRSLRKQSGDLPAGDWPAAVVMRRWLRRPGFRAAMQSIQHALAFQIDMQLSAAAAEAAVALRNFGAPANGQATGGRDVVALLRIVRQAHLRQRFTTSFGPPQEAAPAASTAEVAEEAVKLDPRTFEGMLRVLRDFKADRPISDAILCLEAWTCGRQPPTREMLKTG